MVGSFDFSSSSTFFGGSGGNLDPISGLRGSMVSDKFDGLVLWSLVGKDVLSSVYNVVSTELLNPSRYMIPECDIVMVANIDLSSDMGPSEGSSRSLWSLFFQ